MGSLNGRLYVRGYRDTRGESLMSRSPTSSRLAQRLLVSTSVIMSWMLVSLDVSSAFMKGAELSSTKMKTGEIRKACMKPPGDAWKYLSPSKLLECPEGTEFMDRVGELAHEVYGLKDASLLWAVPLMDLVLKGVVMHMSGEML